MTQYTLNKWLFPIEQAPVYATIDLWGKMRKVRVPRKKALVAIDTGKILGIVGPNYNVLTNQEAVTLCQRICLKLFPDTKIDQWSLEQVHGPDSRSWASLDIHHWSSHMLLTDSRDGPGDFFTPFVRITNSFNRSRARRIDVGFMNGPTRNGFIFEQNAAVLTPSHTRRDIDPFRVASPIASMTELSEEFRKNLVSAWAVRITREEAMQLVRLVLRLPGLPENPKPWARIEQTRIDAYLDDRLRGSFRNHGEKVYAVVHTMAYIAFYTPQWQGFRRDRSTLERCIGTWLRLFHASAAQPGFNVTRHLADLKRSGDSETRDRSSMSLKSCH